MRMTAIIPTKDRTQMLAETLESLSACTPLPDEVIVVDGSPEATARPVVEAAVRAHPALPARHLASPPGLCRQRNRAVREATGDVIVFLDDDVFLDPAAFAEVARAFEDPATVGMSGRVEEPDPRRLSLKRSRLRDWLPGSGEPGTMTRYGYPNRLQSIDDARDLEFLSGCFMAARADLVRELGFDERLEALAGYALAEDEDFGYRLSRRGRLRYVPSARVVHRNTGFGSSRAREFNRQLVYNRDYLFRKNFPQTASARAQWWLVMGVHVAHRALNRDWKGMAGLLDGLRLVLRR